MSAANTMPKLPRLPRNPLPLWRWLVALLALAITVQIEQMPAGSRSWFANEWLRDQFILLRAQEQPEQRFVMVDIDESSLKEIGPWPWSRAKLADMLEILISQYQVRGIAVDMVLPEPLDIAGDTRLANLSRFGPVVLAQAFDYNGNFPQRVGNLLPPLQATGVVAAVPASGYVGANRYLAQPGVKAGNIGLVPDLDGMIRRLPLYTSFDARAYPGLTMALMQCCHNPQFRLQAQEQGFWRVPYRRAWSAYTVIPASYILQQKLPLSMLENKLVLLGSSSLGLADRAATPLLANGSGLLVHAAALSHMLDVDAGLAPQTWPGKQIAYIYSAVLALLTVFGFARWSALVNIALLVCASIGWIALAYFVSLHDPAFSTTAPLISNLFLLIVAVPLAWQTSQRMSRRLLGTLRQYVAPAVVDELMRSNLQDPLAPKRCQVTTLIADMQGYTSQVEALSAEQAADLTRDFLSCLTAPVLEMRGTLDKFTGDGLVAFWGAPLPEADHADLALDAASAMLEAVRAFSARREREGKAPLRVRIGIESGEAMAGDFGSELRSIYTAVGDSVNVASRLEQVARDYPYDVIIGQGTASICRRHSLILLGELMLRGKEKPTTIYSLHSAASLHVPAGVAT